MRTWIAGVVLSVALAGTAVAYENEPSGFRGLNWGTPFTQLRNDLTLVERDGPELLYYTRANDLRRFDRFNVERVYYEFFSGRLVGGWIWFHPTQDRSALQQALVSRFGPAERGEKIDDRHWAGAVTDVDLLCDTGGSPVCVLFFTQHAHTIYMQNRNRNDEKPGDPTF
jgi:hypothetical protein